MDMEVRFDYLKDEIIDKLLEKTYKNLGIAETVTLVDGFINFGIQDQLNCIPVIVVPMIALVGDNTGRVYFFSLKALGF